MKIALISPYGSLMNYGLRIMSSCLQQAGHDPCLIFLPNAKEVASFLLFEPSELYEQSVIEQVVELCSDASLVGISVMTHYFDRASQLTAALHQHLSVPVIWGGIHPTVRPAECLEHADLVCVGEGEEAIVELADRMAAGQPYGRIANLGYRSADGQLVINPPRPLIRDLDSLPFPSFRLDNQYVLHGGQVRTLTPSLLHFYLMDSSSTGEPVYPVLSTRGCPHRCSYCANDAIGEVYPDWRHVRRRSNGSLVAEIQAFREQFPFVGEVAFHDDVFVAAPAPAIEAFSRVYREQVGLPFYCIVSPLTLTERKLTALLDAGLVKLHMGIETGSRRTQQLYTRPIGNKAILRAAHLINKYADHMLTPAYDVISDNPYEGPEDELETLRLLQQIPHPYRLLIFSLVFYPGTRLYERAIADGLIHDEKREIHNRNFLRLQPSYYNLVIYGYHRRFPRWLLRFMSHPPVFLLFSAPTWRPLWRVAHWGLKWVRTWYNWRRLRRYRRGVVRLGSSGESTAHGTFGAQSVRRYPDHA